MASEPLTLEEFVERATHINNYESNEAQCYAVANQVNREIGGPSTVVKLLIQRLQHRQEIVTLQALNVIECCVKNCGGKLHNEIGKYKFINELIKLLSPKYDGDITPQSIKDRIIELLFAWYVGLPQEKKIGEAYKMLKQQGIIKRDPVDPYQQGAPMPSREPQNTVFEDEGKSELLKTLLTSTDPDDLQSANKLIKTMVKEEEERLERVSKRIQDLETVSNNVKLLDEMLAKHSTEISHSSLEIMNDLYESCLKMRPELFRLASRSAEDKDDAMAEILSASDELTRVIDSYKETVLLQKIVVSHQKPYHLASDEQESANSSSLLDLGFDGPAPSNSHKTNTATSENSFLDEQFKLLGLDNLETSTQQQPNSNGAFDHYPNMSPPPPQQHQQQQQQQQPNLFYQQQQPAPNNFSMNMSQPGGYLGQPPFYPTATTAAPTNMQPLIGGGGMRPAVSNNPAPTMNIDTAAPMSAPNKHNSSTTATPQRKDLLDFDVFSEFRSPEIMKSKKPVSESTANDIDKVDGASQSVINHLLDMDDVPALAPLDSTQFTKTLSLTNPPIKQAEKPVQPSVEPSLPSVATASPQPLSELPIRQTSPTPPQENYLVPLEALKPGEHEPIVIYDKNGLKTFVIIATDTREGANQNVIVTILSTISTNSSTVKDFAIQVAVPKVMRVKLQPATSNEFSAFNPILPPSSITQIMLIANPTKESVRLRFKLMYNVNGVQYSENASVDQLPVR